MIELTTSENRLSYMKFEISYGEGEKSKTHWIMIFPIYIFLCIFYLKNNEI